MEWTNAFYEDLDRIAAEGVAGRCDTKIGGVAQGIRGRPFRHMRPRDVAEAMAPLTGKPAEVAEREAVPTPSVSMERLRYHVLKAKPTSPLYVQHGGRAAMALSPPPPEEREQAQRRCPAQHVEKLVAEEKPRRETCKYMITSTAIR
jgi:malate synthase